MKRRAIFLVLLGGLIGCNAQQTSTIGPSEQQSRGAVQNPQKQSGKVFSESELVAMGFQKTDLRPQNLEPVFVKKAVPLGDLARELCFTIDSVQATIQASGPDDACHVIIPTGICYIGYVSESAAADGRRNPKALVNATVLQIPLRKKGDKSHY